MSHKKCPFCPIVKNNKWFSESENFVAIYNLSPILPGHSMIIPKKHAISLLNLDNDLLAEIMIFSRETVKLLQKAFKTKHFDWTIQEGEPAGQSIEHLHLHLIPRSFGDLPEGMDWSLELQKMENGPIDSHLRPRLSTEEMDKMIDYLRSFAESKTT